jgi:hypothetical protein
LAAHEASASHSLLLLLLLLLSAVCWCLGLVFVSLLETKVTTMLATIDLAHEMKTHARARLLFRVCGFAAA